LNKKTMRTPPLKYRLGLFSVLTVLFAVCFLMVFGLAVSFAQPLQQQPVRWESDLNAAMLRAEREQRPLFLHFVGNDSPSAQQMWNEVFVQPNIVSHLNANFVMVKINASENPALAQRFAVTAIPTDLIMKPNGQPIHRRVGVITADRFAKYLVFLQETIQAERNQASAPPAGSFPMSNPPGSAQPTPPAALMPPTAPPQQRETIAIPSVIRDPFTQQPIQQPAAAQPPAAVGGVMPPPSVNNQARTPETAARPASDYHTGTPNMPGPHISGPNVSGMPDLSRTPGSETAPPVANMGPAISAEMPAPPKMMVEVPLALEGFCPVILCKEERWVSGNPAYCTLYQGHIFRFSSLEALVTFARNPANYTPVAMGEDVVLRVDRNRRVNGDRRYGAWFQGRVFLFSSQETFSAFESRPDYYAEIALKYETARREQPVPIVY
jgi:YHS domain-containing protein/thioredoxin-related protein